MRSHVLSITLVLLMLASLRSFALSPLTLAILPEVTLATNVANADSDVTKPGLPGVASDGTNYLVLSCRYDNPPLGLFGVLVSSEGAVLNSFFITDAGQFANPSAAFDGTNYLIVFQRDGSIYGFRVSPSGNTLDGPEGFLISTGSSNWKPNAAFDGTNYLVVWDKFTTNYGVYGSRIATSGQVFGEFPIFAAPGEQVLSTVTFGAGNYFVVWRDTPDGSGPDSTSDIYGTRVSPEGRVLDPAGIPVCTAPGVQDQPQVTTDGQNYFVDWADGRELDSSFHIYGTRVSPGGLLLDGPSDTGGININDSFADQVPGGLCFDGSAFFVTWWDYSYVSPVGIYGARVSTTGLLSDGPATDLGIQLATPEDNVNILVNPNPASNGQSVLIPYVQNNQYSGETKSILAQLLIPQPAIVQIINSNTAAVTLVVASQNNQRFSVQVTTNLSATASWQNIETNFIGANGLLNLPLPVSAASPAMFFRLSVNY